MRDTFVKSLCELALTDKRLTLVTGDLGFGVLVPFWNNYPEQFLNAGIAEQNMTGIATGLALEGKIVFTYSIANFPTLRCLEQIRNDAAYHNANVKIVAVGGGFCYGSLGMSHHATEDIAVMRALPNVVVMAPGDPREAEAAVKAIYEYNGTCYLRLGRGGEPNIHSGQINMEIGKALEICKGNTVAIFSTGGILCEAYSAVQELKSLGISAALYSFPTIKPMDNQTVEYCSNNYSHIITIEEHNIVGGFGSAVAEVMAGMEGTRAQLIRLGLNDKYSSIVGDQNYLRYFYGISAEEIVKNVKKALSVRGQVA